MAKIIGIDLGTTNSLVSYWQDGEVKLIPNSFGEYLTPSVVSVDDEGNVYVGKVAKERLISAPESTVSVFKRSMGTERTWKMGGKWYRPEELAALVLKKLKEDAGRYFGEPVEEAIISVPAYFHDMARKATREAGLLAGLKVERIINEPSAAALACRHMRKKENGRFLVYDFGGGTLDVSLVEVFENVIEITAVSGDNRLGGSDFDRVIAGYFCEKQAIHFEDLPKGQRELLLKSCEKLKRELSVKEEAVLKVISPELSGELKVSRKDLIQLAGEILGRMYQPVKRVLKDGKIRLKDISQVILVGGSCKMPLVRQYLEYRMPGCEIVAEDPDYMVALGVGIYAGIKERDDDIKDLVMSDICPFSLGTSVLNWEEMSRPYMSVLIGRNSVLPVSRTEEFCTSFDNQNRVEIGVFQGEGLYADENLKLGQVQMEVPPDRAGEQKIMVTFHYDINGLFVMDAEVASTGKRQQLILVNGKEAQMDEVLQKKMEALDKVKVQTQNSEEMELIKARGERLYTQLTGAERERLGNRVKEFTKLLNCGSDYEIYEAARNLKAYLDELERTLDEDFGADRDPDDFMKWVESHGKTARGI